MEDERALAEKQTGNATFGELAWDQNLSDLFECCAKGALLADVVLIAKVYQCSKTTAARGASGASLFQKHDCKTPPCNDSPATQNNPKIFYILDVLYGSSDLQAALPVQVVLLLEEKRQHKPSGCIDFAVIDLMVPCDN
ncbi:hypothetical protein F2P81_021149 [Scophthalmus maximus]|uniref:Uncharacterized protein n=1 Tax=Scophthalmus maximus TaxID=52904 RepID=A0A6A4S515_SCOMX|nr:hypothetical protein F2P81_021149 [Scophthalmus maximus]